MSRETRDDQGIVFGQGPAPFPQIDQFGGKTLTKEYCDNPDDMRPTMAWLITNHNLCMMFRLLSDMFIRLRYPVHFK